MVRQERKAEQQTQQIGDGDPLVPQKFDQARHARRAREVRKTQLVQGDDGQTDQRNFKGVMMEQRHTQQREAEQEEIQRDTGDKQGKCLQIYSYTSYRQIAIK